MQIYHHFHYTYFHLAFYHLLEVCKDSMILLALFLFTGFANFIDGATTDTKHYIVYMGDLSNHDSESAIMANHELLTSVTGSLDSAQEAMVYHYSKSFRGFSARLTAEQAQQLAESDSVVSVFESRMQQFHTTHSWEFLGVSSIDQYSQLPKQSKSDIIVGVLDSGVWPESESFSDKGLGPVPKKFKGKCVTGDSFTMANCNRKIIGARFYSKGLEEDQGMPLESVGLPFFRSARDTEGHGTHTASTVAGSTVTNTSLFGIARGTARGGAPKARLAIYKVGWFGSLSDADVLSAFDDAIDDGVDIISMSFGSSSQQSYYEDVNSIGAFHAFQKGILISGSAGNDFNPGTTINVAPWILTVAASSMDRELNSDIYLGNSKVLKGYAINPLRMEKSYALITGSVAAAPGVPKENASSCLNNTLDPSLVKGKIVVCTMDITNDGPSAKIVIVKEAGGVGMIDLYPQARDFYYQFGIPATLIGQEEAKELEAYMATEKHPVAKILTTRTNLKTKPAPHMAVFSSKGPNIVTPDIITPDITAPGVQIFAAWSPVSTEDTAGRSEDYNIISGTSMSCPHVSAVAAILKSHHPSWSPAAIMSAIMTTATIIDNTGHPIKTFPDGTEATPFDYGSGHINPVAALNPGLIYDFDSSDIINFLCSYGASPRQLKNLTRKLISCKNPLTPSYNFNYPSIGVFRMKGSVSVSRTVTYYGKGPTIYFADVVHPEGVKVTVTPPSLKFKKTGEKMSFKVNLTPLKSNKNFFVFGALTWKNGIHRVRSPIGVNVL
uniref:Putative subtilisin-like protease SBT5.3 n=2 Tax=Davidia involucrata TaxID=16924 RepID=A0A5B7A6L3_DAVIN